MQFPFFFFFFFGFQFLQFLLKVVVAPKYVQLKIISHNLHLVDFISLDSEPRALVGFSFFRVPIG
jgi:hypothetical protein